jgi:hypothetical protein
MWDADAFFTKLKQTGIGNASEISLGLGAKREQHGKRERRRDVFSARY